MTPLFPIDPAPWPEFSNTKPWHYEEERREQRAWQVLEEQRLGHILVKAWNQEYQSAKQVMDDIKKVVKNMGMKLIREDEIELEVNGSGRYDQQLQFTVPKKEVSASEYLSAAQSR